MRNDQQAGCNHLHWMTSKIHAEESCQMQIKVGKVCKTAKLAATGGGSLHEEVVVVACSRGCGSKSEEADMGPAWTGMKRDHTPPEKMLVTT